MCWKTNAGCARRAGVWRTADAPDISHPAGSGRGGGCAVGSLFRSKAVWGYDAGFMALMPAPLAVSPKEIAAGDVWIATGIDGQIAGVVALAPGEVPGKVDRGNLSGKSELFRHR